MSFARQLPSISVKPQAVPLAGGLDVVSTPSYAKPGTLAFALNYESCADGGYERIGGIERYDGRAKPSDAAYLVLSPVTAFTGVIVGDTVNGQTSGATGIVVYVGDYIALTKVTGNFTRLENIRVATTVVGVYASTDPSIEALQDNILSALAANVYRLDVLAVPGSGPVRGAEVLDGVVYAWRDNAGATALAIHKATAAGWVEVPLFHEISFDTGTAVYAEGSSITKGGNTATVKRVVLESGTWAAGDAAGRLIITAPSPSPFSAGAAAGGGACSLLGPSTQIALATSAIAPPRVSTRVYNFSGGAGTSRIYGCDGLNREFEFDGTVLAPINTNTSALRATHVHCNKQFLFYAFGGSLLHCSVGYPYVWSAIVGAGELGMGDTINGMATVGGSESSSAMMVFSKNRTSVLYGSGPDSWQLSPISEGTGASAYSIQQMGTVMAHDTPGFKLWSPTQNYGNFAWELASNKVEPLVKGKTVRCSTLVRSKSRYRCFFSDGTAVSGVPRGKGVEWTPIDYSKNIVVACEGEIGGVPAVFYGDDEGFIYEADIGRSFDGATVSAAFKPNGLTQGSTITNKQYRCVDVEAIGESAFTLSYGFEFNDGDPETPPSPIVTLEALSYAGRAMFWDGSNWDQSYWDGSELTRKRLRAVGQGYSISPIFSVNSDSELPHKINLLTVVYTPLRLLR